MIYRLKILLLSFFIVICFESKSIQLPNDKVTPSDKVLTLAYQDAEPIIFNELFDNKLYISGLHLELLEEIAHLAGYTIDYKYFRTWGECIENVFYGYASFVLQATYTGERARKALFTESYETEEAILIALKDRNFNISQNVSEFVKDSKYHGRVIGYNSGVTYPDDNLNAQIKDFANRRVFATYPSYDDLLNALINREVDALYGEKVKFLHMIKKRNMENDVDILTLDAKVPLRFMFNMNTDPNVIRAFNIAIYKFLGTEKHKEILNRYKY